MKSSDIEKVNNITKAINGAVPNLDTVIGEDDNEITLRISFPKSGVVGRPRKSTSTIPMNLNKDEVTK